MNGSMHSGADVALFLDWENFKISLAVGHRLPNVSALKEEVSNYGRVVVAKAYADWVTRSPELRGASQFINDPPALYAAGIDPVYVPTRLAHSGAAPGRTTRVKNSVDVKMTADCIECAHSYPNIGTYVLVSGDSDFIHVINALRTMGKRVIIIGVSWATSRRFSDQVDELILYDVDIDVVAAPEPQPVANDHNAGRAAAARQELSAIIATIEDIVRTERQAGGTPLLTSIKQRLMRRHPSFDEKKFGFSGFKKLMSRVAHEGKIQVVTAGLVDWAIMADEPPPEDASVVSANGSQDGGTDLDETAPQTRRQTFQASPAAQGSNEAIADSTGDGVEENVSDQAVEPDATAAAVENTPYQPPEPTPTAAAVENTPDQPAEPTPTAVAMQNTPYQPAEPTPTAVAVENVPDQPAEPTPTAVAVENTPDQPAEPTPTAVAVENTPDQPDEPTPTAAVEEQADDTADDGAGLAAVLEETLAQLDLPTGPEDDNLTNARVADLIVMADTLEHQETSRHMAFNFLVTEICQALDQGIKAEHLEIMQRWSRAYSKSYITKMIRELGNGNLFVKGWQTIRDKESGRRRRLSTFYLNREHPLIDKVLQHR
jgi:uncharacterized LabA/DUF88 family protein